MKKNYCLIDIAKLVFAIGILAIHSKMFQASNTPIWLILHCFFRLAVPFFFCTSGYFFYRSLNNNNNNNIDYISKKYLKRLIVPMIFWITVKVPIVLYEYFNAGVSIKIIIKDIIKRIVFYPWSAMWYVAALIVAILIIIPFYKKNKLKNIVIIGAFLYLFALICNTYYFLVEGTALQKFIDIYLKIAISARNGIFEGIYFVSVGMLISQKMSNKKISFRMNNILFPILYLLLFIEVLLTKDLTHKDDHSLFLTFLLLIPSLLIFLSQFNISYDTKKIRNYSTGIFFSHSFILGIVQIFFPERVIIDFVISLIIILTSLTILYKIDNPKINYLIK